MIRTHTLTALAAVAMLAACAAQPGASVPQITPQQVGAVQAAVCSTEQAYADPKAAEAAAKRCAAEQALLTALQPAAGAASAPKP